MASKPHLSPTIRLAQRICSSCRAAQIRSIATATHTSSGYQSRTAHVDRGQPDVIGKLHREANSKLDEMMAEEVDTLRGYLLPTREPMFPPSIQAKLAALRLPRSAQLNYLSPLRRVPTPPTTTATPSPNCTNKKHRYKPIDAAELQLRSYSVRNLEQQSDFALRAAYYLSLPAKGPFPLPRLIQRWTVPRSNFIFKKSQENFERITYRRVIKIVDSCPEQVALWLAFIRKYASHGVGFKANVFEYTGLDEEVQMDKMADQEAKRDLEERTRLFGARKDVVQEFEKDESAARVRDPGFGAEVGTLAPMGQSQYLDKTN